MKSAVSEAIRDQQRVNAVKYMVVIIGVPEKGCDYGQQLDMFGFMGCRCDFIRHVKIDRDSH